MARGPRGTNFAKSYHNLGAAIEKTTRVRGPRSLSSKTKEFAGAAVEWRGNGDAHLSMAPRASFEHPFNNKDRRWQKLCTGRGGYPFMKRGFRQVIASYLHINEASQFEAPRCNL